LNLNTKYDAMTVFYNILFIFHIQTQWTCHSNPFFNLYPRGFYYVEVGWRCTQMHKPASHVPGSGEQRLLQSPSE
jgi:hypothetical protein